MTTFDIATRVDPASIIDEARITWAIRNVYSPLRGLTPQLLTTALESYRIGWPRQALILWEAMANRDLTLKTVMPKRFDALVRLNTQVVPLDDSPEAARHAEYLEDFYGRIQATEVLEQDVRGGLKLFIKQKARAIGMKYDVHEIIWKPSANRTLSAILNHCPPWFFESRSGKLRYLPSDFDYYGIDLEERNWCIGVGAGLMEASSIGYLFKNLAVADWANFSEKFGTPGVIGKTDEQLGSEGWNAMLTAVQQFQANFSGVLSTGSDIQLIEPKSGAGQMPQPPFVEYFDRQMIMLWRGGDLSTQSRGGEAIGANAQEEESLNMLEADADWMTETIHHQLGAKAIQYAFGDDVTPLAKLTLVVPKPKNLNQEIAVDSFLISTGVKLDKSQALERYDRKEADSDDQALQVPAIPGQTDPVGKPQTDSKQPLGNQDPSTPADKQSAESVSSLNAADVAALGQIVRGYLESANGIEAQNELAAETERQLAEALAKTLAPLRKRISEIADMEEEIPRRAALEKLQAEIINEAQRLSSDKNTVRILEQGMVAAFFNGLTEKE